ncbi:hypothetical protein ABKN59_011139 [Abortiporus biennis]
MPAFDQIPLVPPGVSLPKVESNLYIMFENELLFPVYAVFASAIVLTIQIFVSTMKNARTKEPDEELENLSLQNAEGTLHDYGIITTYIYTSLLAPRRYVPFDPAEPMPSPNEEQTASWLSYLLFSYCDGTILKAYNRFHITIDDLPVLADSVYAKNLVKHAYPYLDPLKNKKRHLFNGLAIGALGRDYLLCIALLFISAVSSLISPIGMNRLLNFMETGGENTVVRPWFWIAWMFFGPMLSSVANGRYFYTLSVIIAKGRSIMTQLMFDHALRLRMKADATEASSSPSTVATEENSETNSASNDPSTESSADPSSSNATPDDATKKDEDKEAPIKEKDVLRIIFYTPLQLILTERMNRSDARVQNITETLNVVRMVKLFGWETKMEDALAQKRNEELKMIRKSRLIEMSGGLLTYIIPVATTVTTFATFTLIMKRDLTASLVFPAITMFSLIEGHFGSLYFAVPRLVKAKVSLDRIEQFLKNSELLDEYANGSSESPATAPAVLDLSVGDDSNLSPSEELPIGIRASAFTWTIEDADEGSTATVGTHSRKFKLKIEDEVFFKKGCINLIVGPTGSGKTSLLMALLGEMHHIPLAPNALVSLPRHEGIAYHAQESWVLNETIRENILFGSPYDEVRYNAVIVQCGLKHDLSLFDAGDSTEVGEKGITLSGGQKARITLARAIYSPANILLLDDVLAALDVHTAKWIVEKCLKGELVRGRTVILVTHNIALASPIADYVVSLDPEGKIRSQGSLSTALEIDQSLSAELAKESQQIAEVDKEIDEESPDKPAKKAASKLIVEEEVEIGHVSWSAMKLLFENMRFDRWRLWWKVSVSRYIVLYSVCVLASAILMFVSYAIYVFGGIRASRIIHALLIDKMFGTTLRWLDRTPVSRIITRCTEDIQSVDDTYCYIGVSVYSGSNIGSANTGFSLSMASSFSGLLQLWIRIFNIFETSCNSLERINQYLVIEQEPKPTPDGVPPAYWPASGDLRAENLSARYSPDGPEVLKDINFHVKSGERIGIVGRTGSGKSSLTLALLRCILTEGAVYYDNIPTKDINLDILRSNITIIPQVPELLSGTLRQNLDPFSQYDDATLNDALRASGLFSLQNDSTKAKITLDTQISSGGGNLSVGQRQILALARAIIRQSKLLILDEATSAIDYETDTIIQNTLRKELSKDVTLLTVAHRLQTIMDADKVMVLDSGHIVEFDKPSVLLENREGMLRSLVDESVDREKLYSMALGVM